MTESSPRLQEDSLVYKALLESTKAIPWRIDWQTLRFTYIGPQIEELLGWTPESWISVDDWAARMHPEDRDRVVGFCVAQSQAGTDHEADYRALRADGEYVWIRDVVHVVRAADDAVEALIGFMFDISERKRTEEQLLRLQRELEDLSFRDGLTGVFNRRMFDTVLAREWASAHRNAQPLTLVMIDIDHFKEYNDCYGHLAGDDCLRRVAQTLANTAQRPRDFLARFGGEEFVLILPETDAAAAQTLAERLRSAVVELGIPHAGSSTDPFVTVSLGLGSIIPDSKDDDPHQLLRQVDQLLYRAKRDGRNRIEQAA